MGYYRNRKVDWRKKEQNIQASLMNEEKKKELEKFVKENGYNNELKDLYLREFLDQDKKYE